MTVGKRNQTNRVFAAIACAMFLSAFSFAQGSKSAAYLFEEGLNYQSERDWWNASEKYQEALAIIKKGAERLKATPRGDVEEGFVPCAKDRERDARSERRHAEERRVYEAIKSGKKVYDE